MQFEENKIKKQKDRKEQKQLEKENQFKKIPDVNKKSNRIVQEKKKKQIEEVEQLKYSLLNGNPNANTNSELYMKTNQPPVYERLHNIHQEKMQKQVQKMMQQTIELNQTKTMSVTRNKQLKKNKSEANFNSTTTNKEQQQKPIELQLYDDAKRR